MLRGDGMIEMLDTKYLRQRRENGDVYVTLSYWRERTEKKEVKVPVPVIGNILPFIKRKKIVDVVVRRDPAIFQKKVRDLDPSKKNEADILNNVPYDRILNLDEETYGKNLFLGRRHDGLGHGCIYDILTNEGAVIGRFKPEGYYSPDHKHPVLLPDMWSSANNIGFEEIVSAYCAKNPDAKNAIPSETRKQFPDLVNKIGDSVSSQKKAQITLAVSGKEK